jgi:hypothetical protein
MTTASSPARTYAVPALFILVAASLVGGIAGGLLRAGVDAPWNAATPVGRAAVAHAALMICGFFGTVIGIERAVAVKRPWAFAAPVASALAGLAWLAGQPATAVALGVIASLVFVAVNVVVVRLQRAPHTALLLASALAWLAGNALHAWGAAAEAVLPWWFAFLVMTIAAERLEMTRLMRRRPSAQTALVAVLALLLAGAAVCAADARAGGVLFGVSLVLLAAWLALFDIARRTVRAQGLSRYMALCLLGGYAWLAVGGVAWTAHALGVPCRDAALHALGLGFVVSMVMGHAPVILPAVTGVKVAFGAGFYLPLALLHASLLVRVIPPWRAAGAALNAAAILAFAATMVAAAVRWRRSR